MNRWLSAILFAGLAALPAVAQDKAKADDAAIRAHAKSFADAFAKGDAKSCAALWAERGEYHDPAGRVFRGREAIEKAFQDAFKAKPNSKVEILIDSVRFPSPDVAIEDGVVRLSSDGRELPSTTLYTAIHAREGNGWKTALSREWGAGQDRLDDLEWLLGRWTANLKDQEVSLVFEADRKKPYITGTFTRKEKEKTVTSGTMKIGIDPQRGQIRSWHFDDDGGHGQALWLRDGNKWVLDAVGVLGNGSKTASVNVLGRLNSNEITWRSIDRVAGGAALPDTIPIRLKRSDTK